MRHSKTIELSEGRRITVQELRVKDARRLFANLAGTPIDQMLGDKFPEAIALLGECVQLPDGESLDDYPIAEAKRIVDAFIEVNRDFLTLMGLDHIAPTPSSN